MYIIKRLGGIQVPRCVINRIAHTPIMILLFNIMIFFPICEVYIYMYVLISLRKLSGEVRLDNGL